MPTQLVVLGCFMGFAAVCVTVVMAVCALSSQFSARELEGVIGDHSES